MDGHVATVSVIPPIKRVERVGCNRRAAEECASNRRVFFAEIRDFGDAIRHPTACAIHQPEAINREDTNHVGIQPICILRVLVDIVDLIVEQQTLHVENENPPLMKVCGETLSTS